MPDRRPRISQQQTEARMLAAAVDQINAAGLTVSLDHLSFEAVISAADVSRTAAYRQWPNKELFLNDLVRELARAATPRAVVENASWGLISGLVLADADAPRRPGRALVAGGGTDAAGGGRGLRRDARLGGVAHLPRPQRHLPEHHRPRPAGRGAGRAGRGAAAVRRRHRRGLAAAGRTARLPAARGGDLVRHPGGHDLRQRPRAGADGAGRPGDRVRPAGGRPVRRRDGAVVAGCAGVREHRCRVPRTRSRRASGTRRGRQPCAARWPHNRSRRQVPERSVVGSAGVTGKDGGMPLDASNPLATASTLPYELPDYAVSSATSTTSPAIEAGMAEQLARTGRRSPRIRSRRPSPTSSRRGSRRGSCSPGR